MREEGEVRLPEGNSRRAGRRHGPGFWGQHLMCSLLSMPFWVLKKSCMDQGWPVPEWLLALV